MNANADDGVAIDISLASLNSGLGFPFYGTSHTTVNMGTNGFLHFDLNGTSDSLSNQCPPVLNSAAPNNIIAVLWDDLVIRNPPNTSSGGFVQSFSPCPNIAGGAGACVVFQWDNADHFGGGIDIFDFQAILYDNGNILMNYAAGNPEHGSGSTTGLISAGVQFNLVQSCDLNNSIPDSFSVLFTPPQLKMESEPNDLANNASLLLPGVCGVGNISPAADIDTWFLSGLALGDQVFAVIDSQSASPSANSFLEVFANDAATFLAFNDDSGPGLSLAVSGTIVQQPGNVFFRVTESGNASLLSPYFIIPLVVSQTDRATEIEPNENTASANQVRASLVAGNVGGADLDFYSIQVNAIGDVITAIANNDPDRDGLFTNTVLELIAPDGTTSITSSDLSFPTKTSALKRTVASIPGTYFLKVLNSGGPSDTDYDLGIIVNCRTACSDSNGNGICDAADKGPELKTRLQQISNLLKGVKLPKNSKQVKAQKKLNKNLTKLLKDLASFAQVNEAQITTVQPLDLVQQTKSVKSLVAKVLKLQKTFANDKKKATKLLGVLIAGVQ